MRALLGASVFGVLLGLAFILAAALADVSCYAHTGPGPSCAEYPDAPGCLGGLHDMRGGDGGAR